MFKRVNQQQLLKRNVKDIGSGHLNKIRILQSLPLKKLNDSQSIHSSVMSQSRHSSIKSIPNASVVSSEFSMGSSLMRSRSIDRRKVILSRQQAIENLLSRHYDRAFIKSLVQYMSKDWGLKQRELLLQKKIKNFVQSIMQRSNWIKDLIDEFVQKERRAMPVEDGDILTNLLFNQAVHSIKDFEGIIPEIVKKIPDEKIFKQEMILQELQDKVKEIYDPKCLYSNALIKERMILYLEEYTLKRNDLKSDICLKMVPSLNFLESMEDYLLTYQKEIIKLKAQLNVMSIERDKYQQMLQKKSQFTPLNIDYNMLYDMKEKTNKAIRQDLENNIVQYHQEKHRHNQQIIGNLEQQQHQTRLDNDDLRDKIVQLQDQLSSFKASIPQYREFGIQVYNINQSKGSQGAHGHSGSLLYRFLDNVVSPFSFSFDISGSLINILAIDKILFDYQSIRLRENVRSFEQFLFEWFIIRTGCRKIAQIFVKNFLFSLRQLRNSHKRFAIFHRICGHSGYRKRNMLQDLEGVFFSTHLCWYYMVKLSLMYRRKLNENPSGYQLFPPLPCEQIFKLPLRKIYELVQQFFKSEQIEVPANLTQLIDQYCINEISRFKSSDQDFQKQMLEEIHILREINFDFITGFVLEYISNAKCVVVEKLLRTINSKQKQQGSVLGYSEFEAIYRKFYKQRRVKIQQIYAKLCMVNQHDMLNIENLHPVVLIILQDNGPLLSIFEKLQPLKALVVSQKAAMTLKTDKKIVNVNSFQNFKERYYQEFYDFYNTTAFLEEIFKIIKALIKKKLRLDNSEEEVENILKGETIVSPEVKIEENASKDEGQEQDDEQEYTSEQEEEAQSRPKTGKSKRDYIEMKSIMTQKMQQWSKIITRVPHFASKVLTIEQILIHNMRRKEMIDATQFAWRTLREILTVLGKE